MRLATPSGGYDEFSDRLLNDFLSLYTEQFIDLYFEGEKTKRLNELKKIIAGIKK